MVRPSSPPAIALDLGPAAGGIAQAVQANLSTALFKFLEYLPGTAFTSGLAILLVGAGAGALAGRAIDRSDRPGYCRR